MNELTSFSELNRPKPESQARREERRREHPRTRLEESITKARDIEILCKTLQPGDWREGYDYATQYLDLLTNLLYLTVDAMERDPITQAMTPSSLEFYEDILATNEFIAETCFLTYRILTNDFTPGSFTTAVAEGFKPKFTMTTAYTVNILGFSDIHESKRQQIIAYAFTEQPFESLQNSEYIKLANTETRSKMVRYAIQEYFPEQNKQNVIPQFAADLGQTLAECILDSTNNDDNSEDTINALVEHVGPEMLDIISAWKTKGVEYQGDDSSYVRTCLDSFARIWNECGREATLKLYNQYGIRHFHYFPAEVLIAQAKHEQADSAKRFGIVTLPFNDNNGAFTRMKSVIENSWDELKDTHEIVCTEAKHQAELLRHLWRARKNYGNDKNNSRADFIILGGHGSKDTIEFGSNKNAHKITSKHMTEHTNKHASLADNVLQPDGQVILVSCSTGIEGGIAQTAASFFNRTIIGPSNPTNISSMSYTRDETGKIISATPTYWENTATLSYSPDRTGPDILVPKRKAA